MTFFQNAFRLSLLMWAKSGKAPGYLYKVINQHSKKLGNHVLRKRLSNGVVIDCNIGDHVQQQIYFFGAYEPIEVSLLLSTIPTGGVVVDAGANVGFYSLMMAERVGATGQVHSFEPVPWNFSILQKNIGLNPAFKQIHAQALALWHQEEVLEFGMAPQPEHQDNCGGYSAGSSLAHLKQVSCPAVSFSNYFEKNKLTRLDAIKMDIEGAELFALRGMLPLLRQYQPVIQLEICRDTCKYFDYTPEDLWALLKPLGYKIYRVGNVLKESAWVEDFSSLVQGNVLLIPRRMENWTPQWNDKQIRKKFLGYQLGSNFS